MTKIRQHPMCTRPRAPLVALCFSALFLLQALTTVRAAMAQQLSFAGLRTVANQGAINAIKVDAAGNFVLLLNQGDGVRLLKTDPTATTILAQSQLGSTGDVGVALAIDSSGNIFVAGTTTSTTLTGTAAAAFPQRTDASTNSFVAGYDASLTNRFVTFAGSGRLAATGLAATADAVFLTGSLFSATLPVTPNGIQQAPSSGSFGNGFVERFTSDGSTLVYATYLTGANGDTAPAAIVADSTDQVFIAGYTGASGFPTSGALVPQIPAASDGTSPGSGFLAALTPAGDGFVFSTFIPGSGIGSLALDPTSADLLLTGGLDLGRFPIATVQAPLVATQYQALLRIRHDGSAVLASTLLAPGSQSFPAPATDGTVWVTGDLSTPLLPLGGLGNLGTALALHVNARASVDFTERFGGAPHPQSNERLRSRHLFFCCPGLCGPAAPGRGVYANCKFGPARLRALRPAPDQRSHPRFSLRGYRRAGHRGQL